MKRFGKDKAPVVMHATAKEGFGSAAEVYERARPGYPATACDYLVDALGVPSDGTLLDLAAGTGKLTRELVARGVRCVAVEPVSRMRRIMTEQLPEVWSFNGTAENIPLDSGSIDAVTVAQAFHWFDQDAAIAEIARVLKPGGRLAVVFNVRDTRVDWVRRVTEIIDPHEGDVRIPRYRDQDWKPAFERARATFTAVEALEFPHAQPMTPEGLKERVASVSFIAVLPEETRAQVMQQIEELTASHPDLARRASFEHPYVTEVYVYARA